MFRQGARETGHGHDGNVREAAPLVRLSERRTGVRAPSTSLSLSLRVCSFQQVFDVISRPYFHGLITATEAEQALQGQVLLSLSSLRTDADIAQRKGTFLLRFSTTQPGVFCLACINKDNVCTHTLPLSLSRACTHSRAADLPLQREARSERSVQPAGQGM